MSSSTAAAAAAATTTTTTAMPFNNPPGRRQSLPLQQQRAPPPRRAPTLNPRLALNLSRSQTFTLPAVASPTRSPTIAFSTKIRRSKTVFSDKPAGGSSGERKRKALIISGYTCIGKTSFRRNVLMKRNLASLSVVDMDSAAYSKKPEFPENYLQDIRKQADEPGIILISTHPGVASALKREGYYIALVYPEGSAAAKREWLRRLEQREEGGRGSRLYRLVEDKFDEWYDGLRRADVSKQVVMAPSDYLSTVVGGILSDYYLDQAGGCLAARRREEQEPGGAGVS